MNIFDYLDHHPGVVGVVLAMIAFSGIALYEVAGYIVTKRWP